MSFGACLTAIRAIASHVEHAGSTIGGGSGGGRVGGNCVEYFLLFSVVLFEYFLLLSVVIVLFEYFLLLSVVKVLLSVVLSEYFLLLSVVIVLCEYFLLLSVVKVHVEYFLLFSGVSTVGGGSGGGRGWSHSADGGTGAPGPQNRHSLESVESSTRVKPEVSVQASQSISA